MANALFDAGRNAFLTGSVNWPADTIKAMLVNVGTYVVNLATHDFVNDVPSGAIAARSAAAIPGRSATAGVANATTFAFTAVTGPTIGAVIIYKDTGSDATSPLIAYLDTESTGPINIIPTGGDVTIVWDPGANKVFKL